MNDVLMTMPMWILLAAAAFVLMAAILVFRKAKKSQLIEPPSKGSEKVNEANKIVLFQDRLHVGLSKSRRDIWQKLFHVMKGNKLDDVLKDKLEEILYQADIPARVVDQILQKVAKENTNVLPEVVIKQAMMEIFSSVQIKSVEPYLEKSWKGTNTKNECQIIMVVGVNGVGKTTTVGKLAARLSGQGKKVLVGAADTFRAAAKEQLAVWCERAGVEMISTNQQNGDPAAVCYQAVQRATEVGADFCILDTAGRLHNNEQLMEELKKVKRVVQKISPLAPHEILLVLDAMTGQNALKQAKQFHEALELTGVILTKCDGSAKAGCALGIVDQLKVPIRFIGVGETVDDLDLFVAEQFVDALTSSIE